MTRVKLAFLCCRNNSLSEEFAHHLKLADGAKFIARTSKASAIAAVSSGPNAPPSLGGSIGIALPLTARRLNLNDEQWRPSSAMPALSTALRLLLARYVLSASFC
jgi:hypothetical protein